MSHGQPMMRLLHRVAFAALLSLLAAACAIDPALTGEFERAADAEMARRPQDYTNGGARGYLVSRVRDGTRDGSGGGGARGMLWGTMHVSYSNDTMPPSATLDRFLSATSLHVESAPSTPARARRLAELRTAIRDLIETPPDPAALAGLDAPTRAALDWVPLPAGAMRRFSLLGLAAFAGGSDTSVVPAFQAFSIVDANLAGFAQDLGIPVRSLDDLRDDEAVTRALFADPNGPNGAGALRLALRRRPASSAFGDWAMRAYAAGQIARLSAARVGWRADPDDLARADAVRGPLFTARNAAWIPKLEAAFARPGFHAAAFGAGHLLGEDGVVALLRARGWTVTPCPNDACS